MKHEDPTVGEGGSEADATPVLEKASNEVEPNGWGFDGVAPDSEGLSTAPTPRLVSVSAEQKLPEPDGMEHQLHPAAVLVARLTAIIIASLTFSFNVVVLGLLGLLGVLPGRTALLSVIVAVVLWFFSALLSWYWPSVRHRHITYQIDKVGFNLRAGVFWRKLASIPRSRVQHTDVAQGPLQRRFDLATLVVHTAGTENASESVSGLSHAAALRIRDHLIEGDNDDVA